MLRTNRGDQAPWFGSEFRRSGVQWRHSQTIFGRERERQGVSLETISQITKVSSRHLRELETGDFGSLPGGVFRKGILRGYLSALASGAGALGYGRFEHCLAELDRPAETPETLAQFAENISRNRQQETPPRVQPLARRRRHAAAAVGLRLVRLALCAARPRGAHAHAGARSRPCGSATFLGAS